MSSVSRVARSPEKSVTQVCREHTAHTRSPPQSMRRSRDLDQRFSTRAAAPARPCNRFQYAFSPFFEQESPPRARAPFLTPSACVRLCLTELAGQWHR